MDNEDMAGGVQPTGNLLAARLRSMWKYEILQYQQDWWGQLGIENSPLFKLGNDQNSLRGTGFDRGSLLLENEIIVFVNAVWVGHILADFFVPLPQHPHQ